MRRIPILLVFALGALPLLAQKPFRGAEYRTIASFTYGRFEVRMRSAGVGGMLSSFFTYYDPASPWNEIDIETLGRYSDETQYNTIVPTQTDNHVHRQHLQFNPHHGFHVYAIEWTPDYVAWLVDGFETYRQTGGHIALLNCPQKLMMNIWQPSASDWAGSFDPAQLPVYAYYDWVKYYAYTPGRGDGFTLEWTDNFDTFDATRWQKATHTWDGNNAQFVQENAVLSQGYLTLCLTSNATSGYSGGAVVESDVDAPYVVSAGLYDSTMVVKFSEPVEQSSAQDPTHYGGGALTYKSARLRDDQQTVDISVSGTLPTARFPIVVQSVTDRAVPANTMSYQIFYAEPPLEFPVRINVGGPSYGAYLADSIWSAAVRYGAVGGVPSTIPESTPIALSAEGEIYRSSLHGLTCYNVRLPNGAYDVTLMMVEDRYFSPARRLFSASVQGQNLFTNLDLFQTAGANVAYKAVARSVKVLDNLLAIWFSAIIDSSTLSGIQIERVSPSSGVRREEMKTRALGFSIYPNPFNASAEFSFELPSRESVTIDVLDIIGRRVESIDLGVRMPGSHRYRWDARRLPSGLYICTLHTAGAGKQTRKALLVR